MGCCLTREKATEAPKPDASAPVPSPAQPTPAPVGDKKPTEDAIPTEEPLTWTSLEDATLIGLKALNKTWKEIGVIMSPKQTEDLRERYDELKEITIAAQQAEAKDKKAEAKKVEDDTKEDSESAGEGANKKKGKGKKNKEMGAEALEKKAKAMAAKAEAEAEKANLEETNPDSSYEKPLKSILKKGFATQKMDHSSQFPSQYQGRPIIYVDDGDVMSMDDVHLPLYKGSLITDVVNSFATSSIPISKWNETCGWIWHLGSSTRLEREWLLRC